MIVEQLVHFYIVLILLKTDLLVKVDFLLVLKMDLYVFGMQRNIFFFHEYYSLKKNIWWMKIKQKQDSL